MRRYTSENGVKELTDNDQSTSLVKVKGFSMLPALQVNDRLVIKTSNNYQNGDILVFEYADKQIIVHRLLKIYNNTYLCKGDNSFYVEQVFLNQIKGKVILIKRGDKIFTPPVVTDEFIALSFKVNKEFRRNGYNIDSTMKGNVYKEYINVRGSLCTM